ncbi:MAG: hypothetical protein KGQ41_04645 [Alphaproteobacteria bacterium]|nr:hypothetical protein [Alphaproteobacteria bacterium]
MKFTVNVDCTPEEARAFLGLPDFAPMQQAVLSQMQDQVQKNMNAMDPEGIMKMWMPNAMSGMQAFSELQQSIWQQMTSIANADAPAASSGKKRKG